MSKKQKGILFIILSAFCFSLMNMFVKLAGDVPSMQKSFFRNLVAAVFALILILRSGNGIRFENKKNLPFFLIRAFVGTLGILGNFYALSHMNLSDASMLNKLSPFFVLIFSYIFLKEKVSPTQLTAIFVAFIGSLLIIKPTFDFTTLMPAMAGFFGGMCAGGAYTAVRYLGVKGEKGPMIVLFFSAFSCVFTLPYLLFAYHPMSTQQLVSLLLAGLAASGGQFAITAAYSNAPGKEISIYDYTLVIFAAIWSFAIWGEVPDVLSIIGYVIIFGASIVMYIYNNKQEKMA